MAELGEGTLSCIGHTGPLPHEAKMRDEIVIGALLLSFALWATSHVAIVAGLVRRSPRLRAPIALVIAPLAPYWALREGMRRRGMLWILSVGVYAIARAMAEG